MRSVVFFSFLVFSCLTIYNHRSVSFLMYFFFSKVGHHYTCVLRASCLKELAFCIACTISYEFFFLIFEGIFFLRKQEKRVNNLWLNMSILPIDDDATVYIKYLSKEFFLIVSPCYMLLRQVPYCPGHHVLMRYHSLPDFIVNTILPFNQLIAPSWGSLYESHYSIQAQFIQY